jgi:hypothetical protein
VPAVICVADGASGNHGSVGDIDLSRSLTCSVTHKNHGPPLAPLASQITKRNRLIASQDPQAARHAGENLPGPASTEGVHLARATWR